MVDRAHAVMEETNLGKLCDEMPRTGLFHEIPRADLVSWTVRSLLRSSQRGAKVAVVPQGARVGFSFLDPLKIEGWYWSPHFLTIPPK